MRATEPAPACLTAPRPSDSPAAPAQSSPAWPERLLVSWAALALVLLAETLFLTIRHDAGRFVHSADRLSGLIAALPGVLRIGLSVLAAIVILAAWRLRGQFGQLVRERDLVTGLWPWLPLQLAAFAVLEHFSGRVFEGPVPPDAGEVLAWLAAAAGTAFFWLAAILPPRFWPWVIQSGGGTLVMGLVIGLAAWGAGWLVRPSWQSAAAPTFWAAGGLLRLMDREVVCEPDSFVLGTPGFRVRIDPACAGYEGVGLVCLYLGIYLALFRREVRFPQALALLPLGALAAWSLNVVRSVGLILIGDSISPELALGGFHSQAGWLAFNVVALGLVYAAHRSRYLMVQPAHQTGRNPTAAYLAPFLAVVLAQMLTEAFFNSSPALYPLRVILGGAVLAYYWRSIAALRPPADVVAARASGPVWAVLAGGAVFVMWLGLGEFSPSTHPPPDPRAALSGWPLWLVALWVTVRAIGSVVIIPIVEEVAFRGFLLRRLVAADFQSVTPGRFTWLAILISSLLFGLLHGQWLAGTLAGLAYAAVYARRGRLGDAILAHATTNGLITVVALVTGKWALWS